MGEITHFLTYIQKSIKDYWSCEALSNLNGESFTFGKMAEEIERLHVLFDYLDLKKGDKIAICAKNSARWGIAFLSSTSYRITTVPLLNDFTPDSIMHLTDHSDSKILFTDKDIWEKLDPEKMPKIVAVFNISDFTLIYSKNLSNEFNNAYLNWDKLFKDKYPDFSAEDVNYPVDNFEDLALINYTSGTTSAPKGVMLTYRSISSNIQFGLKGIPNQQGWKIVSMLPLAHMYGLAFEFLYQLAGGCHVYFLGKVPSPRVLLNAFAMVKPYMIVTVPLVVEKLFKSSVFPIIEKPSMKFLMKIPIFSKIIKKRILVKLLDAFGGELQHLIIGGAAINREVEDCMKDIHFPYTVGYGMTECGPILGYEDWHKFKKQSCGKAVDRMELKIDSEDPEHIVGEILARGANVMDGYYKNPEATKAAFTKDGWMRTGDLGLIDEKGNIFIKGRSKNMILSANGQNIYPEEIEDSLNNQPYVVESVVVERDKKIVALVYPDFDRVSQESMDENDLAGLMEQNRIKLNLMLPLYSRIAKIELIKNEFEKTPKRSIKRFLYK
ncbi:MAG: AMP-binding protein [Bacteroidales bacterium]|nr:AMP-binding protein [Bacteroidales bacterium]